ncbi:GCN5 family acetyltransferase [Melittangium boletus DSM 14713]|uniref:GCN5 family acetyltransferase n=3 Tax=Archangiaceae TaxID=39 RepID=A0A250IGY3_9BACT|nr:GCN5 family acetyltransferase [Melittangium boletus DSM 14713]
MRFPVGSTLSRKGNDPTIQSMSTQVPPTPPRPSRSSQRIRPYQAEDWDAVYDICVRTGAMGEDARGLLADASLLPDIYAGPYLTFEPNLAFVVEDAGRVVGYTLGTANTAAFIETWRERWLPRVASRYPPPVEPTRTTDEWLVSTLHHPERMLTPEIAPYPAHLHLDLLPEARGGGNGRRLLEAFFLAAAAAGAHSVHMGTNAQAAPFFARMGFARLPEADHNNLVFFHGLTGPLPSARAGT